MIEEIFFRLNNSTPLTKPQKAMPLCGVENAKFIKTILSDKFFSEICQFSALQRRKSDDMCTLLQAIMLLDSRYEGYEFSSISADEIMRYASHIKNNYLEEQKERLYDIIDYLERFFPEKEKMLKKINIPIAVLAADTSMGDGYDSIKGIYRVGPMYFRQWFSYFFDECYETYKQYCSSGSIKKEKTLRRIEIMEGSLKEYFELKDSNDANQDGQAPSLIEANFSSDGAIPLDGSAPSTDAGLSESDPSTESGAENPDFQEEPVYASVAEDAASAVSLFKEK